MDKRSSLVLNGVPQKGFIRWSPEEKETHKTFVAIKRCFLFALPFRGMESIKLKK
jgi:hypothetical protein